MNRTAVRSDGTVSLGDAAARLGFRPGALVDVIVTCTGTLMIALNTDAPTYDASFLRLSGKPGPKAIEGRAS